MSEKQYYSPSEVERIHKACDSIREKLDRSVKGEKVTYTMDERYVFLEIISQLQKMNEKEDNGGDESEASLLKVDETNFANFQKSVDKE